MALIRLYMSMSLDGAAAFGRWASGRLTPLLGLLAMDLRDGGG